MVRSTEASHPTGAAAQLGVTMIELVVVMVIIGVVSMTAYPRMQAAFGVRAEGWHDSVVSALRLAQKSAVARRRLTCVTLSNNATVSGVETRFAPAPHAATGTPMIC